MKKTKIFKKCFIGILFIVAGGIYLGTSIANEIGSHKGTNPLIVNPSEEITSELTKIEEDENAIITSTIVQEAELVPLTQKNVSESIEKKIIVVHVCGCVTQPDVYELKENDRVIDAVHAAKGFTKDAATNSVNQAQLLNDGQRIYIPSKEEIEEGFIDFEPEAIDSDSKENHLINLNLATKEDLMTLPGIGESKAERILAYRSEQGRFQSIEDIKKIAGVKEAIFSKIKDYITVN